MQDTSRGMMSRHGSRQGKRMAVVLWSLLFLLMCSVVHAEPVSSKDPLIEHLEFLGYECDLSKPVSVPNISQKFICILLLLLVGFACKQGFLARALILTSAPATA